MISSKIGAGNPLEETFSSEENFDEASAIETFEDEEFSSEDSEPDQEGDSEEILHEFNAEEAPAPQKLESEKKGHLTGEEYFLGKLRLCEDFSQIKEIPDGRKGKVCSKACPFFEIRDGKSSCKDNIKSDAESYREAEQILISFLSKNDSILDYLKSFATFQKDYLTAEGLMWASKEEHRNA